MKLILNRIYKEQETGGYNVLPGGNDQSIGSLQGDVSYSFDYSQSHDDSNNNDLSDSEDTSVALDNFKYSD